MGFEKAPLSRIEFLVFQLKDASKALMKTLIAFIISAKLATLLLSNFISNEIPRLRNI